MGLLMNLEISGSLSKIMTDAVYPAMKKMDFAQNIVKMERDLYHFAYKLTSDYDSANDLVQDCILQH